MKKVLVIAEAGVNHNGSIDLAKKLVDEAINAKVDIIKFQAFIAENLASKQAEKAEYQKKLTNNQENQFNMLKKLELSFDEVIELSKYCQKKNIEFLCTAFDLETIQFLKTLDMKRWKIPSGEITNLPYLIEMAKIDSPIILSTGMSTMNEVTNALNVLNENGKKDITVLHCTTEYPTPYIDVNLMAMKSIGVELEVPIGYSDHTNGIEIPIAAVAIGATVIEKHFTLDRNMEGPDHKASLEPHELKAMVDAIRNVERAMGNGEKKPAESEIKNIPIARKSIIASRHIKKGALFTEDNLTVKRPGSGISPMRWFEVLGQRATKDFEEDELIVL
jgi:N,N'-diacetyllegionaminate synthase